MREGGTLGGVCHSRADARAAAERSARAFALDAEIRPQNRRRVPDYEPYQTRHAQSDPECMVYGMMSTQPHVVWSPQSGESAGCMCVSVPQSPCVLIYVGLWV